MKLTRNRQLRVATAALLAVGLPLIGCSSDVGTPGTSLDRPNLGNGGSKTTGTTGTTTTTTTTGVDSNDTLGDDTTTTTTTTTTAGTTGTTTTTTTGTDSTSTDSGGTGTDSTGTDPLNWVGDDFEANVGKWDLGNGVWQVGMPTGAGSPKAHGGSKVVGTVLAGNYPGGEKTALLVSPQFAVPLGESARVRYWQWVDLSERDYGKVMLRVDGVRPKDDDDTDTGTGGTGTGTGPKKGEIDGEWMFQHSLVGTSLGKWTQVIIDIPKEYAGRRAQLAFELNGRSEGAKTGWYLDDVRVESGPMDLMTSGFESGWKDWSVHGGIWDVGKIEFEDGPVAFEGVAVAGTVINGNYPAGNGRSTRLSSPRMRVPKDAKAPKIRFAHWYRMSRGANGRIQMRVNNGPWETIDRGRISGDRGDEWDLKLIDLREFRGKEVQLGFRFEVDSRRTDAGWYIDDVEIDLK